MKLIKPTLLLLVMLQLFCWNTQSQTMQWAKRGGGVSDQLGEGRESVKHIITDNAGNVFALVTVTKDFLDIDGHLKTAYMYNGYRNADAIVSFSCDGTYRWSKVISNTTGSRFDGNIKLDSAGNVYVVGSNLMSGGNDAAGYMHYDTDFIDPNRVQRDKIVKYSNTGDFIWVKHLTNSTITYDDYTNNVNIGYGALVDINAANHLFIWADLTTGTFFNGALTIAIAGTYMLELDSNGVYVASQKMDYATNNGYIKYYARNNLTGAVYIAGTDRTYATDQTPAVAGGVVLSRKMFMVAFNAQGQVLWVHQNAQPSNVQPTSGLSGLVVEETDGSVYVSGGIVGTGRDTNFYPPDTFAGQTFNVAPDASFSSGLFDAFVMKFNPAGQVIWSKNAWKNVGETSSLCLNGNEVAIGRGMNLANPNYPTQVTSVWEGESIVYTPEIPNGSSGTIIRLNKQTGDLIGFDQSSPLAFNALASDNLGNYYGGGFMSGTTTVGNSTITHNGGESDFFILKAGTSNCGCQVPTCRFKATGAGSAQNVYFKYQGQEVYTSVSWNFGDGSPLSSEVNPTHQFPSSGIYNVCLTATNSCDSYQYCHQIDTTLLKNQQFALDKNENLLLYPNPASEMVFIQWDSKTSDAIIEVYDLTGRLMERTLTNTPTGRWQLNTSRFAVGSYIVFMKENGRVVAQHKLLVK